MSEYRCRIKPGSPRVTHTTLGQKFERDRGWHTVTEEQVRHLKEAPLYEGNLSGPKLFDVETLNRAQEIDRAERREKMRAGTPDRPIGADGSLPIEGDEIVISQAELDRKIQESTERQLANILARLGVPEHVLRGELGSPRPLRPTYDEREDDGQPIGEGARAHAERRGGELGEARTNAEVDQLREREEHERRRRVQPVQETGAAEQVTTKAPAVQEGAGEGPRPARPGETTAAVDATVVDAKHGGSKADDKHGKAGDDKPARPGQHKADR